MNSKNNHAILLVNLGTPKSFHPKDVKRYLKEFLMDGRVIDIPYFKRSFLVNGIIIPKRLKTSSSSYKGIWDSEKGSPLLFHSNAIKNLLQDALPAHTSVHLAMRYQAPSLSQALDSIENEKASKLTIIPLFPQYASATTGSIFEFITKKIMNWQTIPKINFISSYFNHPDMIDAFASNIQKTKEKHPADHILFSYHGLPERQLLKAHPDCLNHNSCNDLTCYKGQCLATTQAIAQKLDLEPTDYSVSFQSRLGKSPWIQPYTTDEIQKLVRQGKKNILVSCPSFVCDCLETLFEIGVELREEFKSLGGEELTLVPSLNSHPKWIQTIEKLTKT